MGWTKKGSLRGPKGEPGERGPQGPQGPKGDAGATTWDGIAGKPSAFPPSGHTHDAGDIKSGALPISRGGTGARDSDTARVNLGVCKLLWAGTHSGGGLSVSGLSRYDAYMFVVSNGSLSIALMGNRKADGSVNAQTAYFDAGKTQYTVWAGGTSSGDWFNSLSAQALVMETSGWAVSIRNWNVKEIWGVG